jgi:hypothetical protein
VKRKKKKKESRTEKEGKRREENKKKQGKEAKTSVAIVFFFTKTSSQRPGAVTAVPSPLPVLAPGKSMHSLRFAFSLYMLLCILLWLLFK